MAALRVVRLLVPSGAEALRAGTTLTTIHKAGIHTSSVRSLEYGWWAYMMGERTTPRFNEFSKIISVDGNLASGKGALAQKLADKLGMHYMPEVDPLTWTLPGFSAASMCSLEKFYADPKAADGNSYRLQLLMYQMRLLQYSDAVEHLIKTGQGVILERSPYSDIVFLEAMYKQGYIRKQCVEHYNEIRGISICEFLPPHGVIYVDTPAEEVQKKLQQSGKNVPLAYLKSIEDAYKKNFLPKISESVELLAYDATQAQDIDRVAEDIELAKFDKGPWLEQDDVTYHYMRMLVEDKWKVAQLVCIPRYLPEITLGAHEVDEAYYTYRSLPGNKYAPGYNVDVGDKLVWLK